MIHRKDIILLFATRIIRMFCYGFLSVILVLYLAETGLTETQIGLAVHLHACGDAGISLWLTTHADSFGRKRTLLIGAFLMLGAGIVFILTDNIIVLMIAAIIGVISPSGNEIGPFLSVEQAGLTELVSNQTRTKNFAWYNLAGSFSTATGALSGGWLAQILQSNGWSALEAYRFVLMGYAFGGFLLTILFLNVSSAIEVSHAQNHEKKVLGLASLTQCGLQTERTLRAGCIRRRADRAKHDGILVPHQIWRGLRHTGQHLFWREYFGGYLGLAGCQTRRKDRADQHNGLHAHPIQHSVDPRPLMPTLPLAIGLLLLRFSISQMDVPTRQSYTVAVVAPDERSAAAGVTAIARSVGASLSPALTGLFFSIPILFSAPFFFSGGLKIIYDLLLFREFRSLKPPEEET
jgi:MFS family permease